MALPDLFAALLATVQVDVGRRGLEPHLFRETAADFAPACWALARASRVAILTGFFIPGPDRPETDGPPGAAFLAHTLHSLGIPAVVLAEESCHAALRAADVPVALPEAMPSDCTHVVAIERVGPAADGRYYTMRGRDITAHMAEVRPLLAGRGTIGIGDGGNEIGMGKLPADLIAEHIPNGVQIACRVATDHLIVAGISNWGAYALALGTALAAGARPTLGLDRERALLAAMVAAGLIDGVTGAATLSVDGLPWEEYAKPLARMRELVA
jgi:hypothetical protein